MANELMLKYGCNPNQKPSKIFMKDGGCLLYTSSLKEKRKTRQNLQKPNKNAAKILLEKFQELQ